ncbi:DUF2996 domain-containing protein [Prochlorococcus sp. MIT 1307]|uniref:DUF2996 domain-containing protein n=1 Tax=Prochlorococcus sp. MIT 1307 TaxID=3096219 RepID=UPI002A75BFE7|nr:DUF2996 domain-containing protein [Prochlorococcus sp. MIT 1307]
MGSSNIEEINTSSKPPKPLKPEDKPFEEFITHDFIPGLNNALTKIGFPPDNLLLKEADRPVTGGMCWIVSGQLPKGRRFWLCFSSNKITSSKVVALAEEGAEPTVLESFLIDERKITLALLISRLLQRLNGQKWLGAN